MIVLVAIPVSLLMGAWFIYMFSWIYHYGKYYAEKQLLNSQYLHDHGSDFLAALANFFGHVYLLICYIFRIALFMAGAGLGWYIVLHFLD